VPELPDLTMYNEALKPHVGRALLENVELTRPSLLRSVDPPLFASVGRCVYGFRRIGKRIVISPEDLDRDSERNDDDDDIHLVFHLMVTGRFRW
jgi:formamidopyrimidine-DNA glycosylase